MADDGSAPSLAGVALADGAEGEVVSELRDRVDWEKVATTEVDGKEESLRFGALSPQPPRIGVPVVGGSSAQPMVVCVGAEVAVLTGVVPGGVDDFFLFVLRDMGP